jgi:hypothetical protein
MRDCHGNAWTALNPVEKRSVADTQVLWHLSGWSHGRARFRSTHRTAGSSSSNICNVAMVPKMTARCSGSSLRIASIIWSCSSSSVTSLPRDFSKHASTTIPARSFKLINGDFTFQGRINGVKLYARIRLIKGKSYELFTYANCASLTGTSNPVRVGLTIGDDSGSTTVTAKFGPGPK